MFVLVKHLFLLTIDFTNNQKVLVLGFIKRRKDDFIDGLVEVLDVSFEIDKQLALVGTDV